MKTVAGSFRAFAVRKASRPGRGPHPSCVKTETFVLRKKQAGAL